MPLHSIDNATASAYLGLMQVMFCPVALLVFEEVRHIAWFSCWPGKKSLAHCGSVFGFLLDDSPLPRGESSSSALTAMAFHTAGSGGKDSEQDSRSLQEVEKGLLM